MGAPFDYGDYQPVTWFAYEQLPVSTTSLPLTATTYLNAKVAVVAVNKLAGADGVRYRYDADPSATVGMELEAGDAPLVIWGTQNIQDIEFIRRDAADVTLNILYGR